MSYVNGETSLTLKAEHRLSESLCDANNDGSCFGEDDVKTERCHSSPPCYVKSSTSRDPRSVLLFLRGLPNCKKVQRLVLIA